MLTVYQAWLYTQGQSNIQQTYKNFYPLAVYFLAVKTEKATDGLTEKALCKAWKDVRQRALWIYGGEKFQGGK